MPVPRFCPNPKCPNHTAPQRSWLVKVGFYTTIAHGWVQRYRCRICRSSVSDQTESVHYYAKRRLPLKEIGLCLNGGTSMRDIGRRYGVSCTAVRNGVLRMGRQAMAAQITMLNRITPRDAVVFDGLRSFVTSQDYPCDINTVVDRDGEVILTMTHAIRGRGGRMTPWQKERLAQKREVWKPRRRTMRRAITLLVRELWDYLRPGVKEIDPAENAAATDIAESLYRAAVVDTDEDHLYAYVLNSDRIWRHMLERAWVIHRRTSGKAPRTWRNPLFPVNYVDMLLRHRVKEHTRETIAFGRHSTVQMHRAWIFAWDHNMCREYRVKKPALGVHAEQGTVDAEVIRSIRSEFYERRLRLRGEKAPWSIRQVWTNQLQTPPVRWRSGQKGSMVRIPGFALADLAEALPSWGYTG